MAELVNQRIEDMIRELEQMRRTNLYDDEEIREISRKRKEYEYRIQRRVKHKEDYIHYITYELALLEDIGIRRKKINLNEKKKEIEYAIASRVNKIFKQLTYRFRNDIEVYFEYIKFCKSVGFKMAVSTCIADMLLFFGDKPKMWVMASKWESENERNLENAKNFLLKGIHRHPESDVLYLELFRIELMLYFKASTDEEKEKQLKRVDVIWKNGTKNVPNIEFLFQLCDIALKYNAADALTDEIKQEIWARRDKRPVWIYIAEQELQGCHWKQIEQLLDEDNGFPKEISYCIAVYEEALQKFPDDKLCTRYIYTLLGISENVTCLAEYKIKAVKHAWMYGHENGLLSNDMYAFGIEFLRLENETSDDELLKILDAASKYNPKAKYVWEEKMLIHKNDDKMISTLLDATKVLTTKDALDLWNLALDRVESADTFKMLYSKFKNCENAILLALKPKFLEKMYKHSGLKAARSIYEELIKIPPTQLEVHKSMIQIENSQETLSIKMIRKCYECAVLHHGNENVTLWIDYMTFEISSGNIQASPAIYRRAIATLKKELVDEFVKAQTLAKLS